MRFLSALPTSLLVLLTSATLSSAQDEASDVPTVFLDDGLIIELTSGPVTCNRPTKAGDTISVHYKGTLQDTGAGFDDSYSRGSPFVFTVGHGEVIAGWDEGLLDMCIGQSRKLIIPPSLAYGDRGAGNAIPPKATIVFETKLMDIVTYVDGGSEGESYSVAPLLQSTSSASPTVVSSASPSKAASPTPSPTEDLFTIATAAATPPEGDKSEDDEEFDEVDEADAQEGLIFHGDEDKTASTTHSGTTEDDSKPPTSPIDQGDDQAAKCSLLGPLALLVQGALGALALLTLVWKRWRETPKRPWRIFLFDVSKQVIGSMLTHVINLAMSMISSIDMANAAASAAAALAASGVTVQDKHGRTPNPCSYYLINLAIDTTLGVPVLWLLLKVLHGLFRYTPLAKPPQSIKSGNYGTPPKVTWYLKQLLIYCIGLVGMKLCVFFLFAALPWLPWIGDWALRWTKGNEALEITFALFIFPLAMNAVQYWVIDNFIMDKKVAGQGYEQVADEDEPAVDGRHVLGDDDDEDDDDADAVLVGGDFRGKLDVSPPPPLKEINPTPVPAYDEDARSGGSSNRKSR